MHDRELFEKAFSPLHASPDTLTEVRKTMRNEKKTRRALGKSAVVAIAAALTLTIAVAGGIVTLIRADVSPADKVDDTTHHAFTDDLDATTPTVDDGKGSLVPVPDMERNPGDIQTTQRLVGKYLSKLDAEMTVEGNTIRLGTLLIDESGSGMLTYSVENPNGVKYTDAGYGEAVDMSAEPSMWLGSAPDAQGYGGTCINSRCHVDEDASTDTRLQVVLYFAAGKDFQKGDDFYFTVCDSARQPYSIAIQPQTYVPVKTLTAKNGELVTLSALGMTIVNPDPSREIHTDEVLVNAKDGSSFAVESSSKNLMNWVIGSITGDGQAAFENYTYVFNRLVDVNEVGSVTLTGYYYNLDGSDNDTVSRDGGEVVLRQLVKPLPHAQRPALPRPLAHRGVRLETGDGRKVALRQLQYLPEGVVLRLPGQAIAAADAVDALHQTGGLQHGHEPFDVFQGDVLPGGHLLHGYKVPAAVLRQIQQHADGIAAFRGDHRLSSCQKIHGS